MTTDTADKPHLAIRADAMPEIGYGHLLRCLSVADAYSHVTPAQVTFHMSADSDAQPVRAAGYDVLYLSNKSIEEWIDTARKHNGPSLIDTRTLTVQDLQVLRKADCCCILFDDSGRLGQYPVDAVIDYAPHAATLPHDGEADTRYLLGLPYYPVRKEFWPYRPTEPREKPLDRILLTFGGSDPDDATAKLLALLLERDLTCSIGVILGPGYRGHAESLAKDHHHIEILRAPGNLPELFAAADLAIASSGGTALELAYLGIPALLAVLCEDQIAVAQAVSDAGAAINLGHHGHLKGESFNQALDACLTNPHKRLQMSQKAVKLIDGQGGQRIAECIIETWKRHQTT